MYLSSIFANPERVERLIEIGKNSFQPLLEGAIVYTIPLTLISFIFGLALAIFTALARISGNKALETIAGIYVSAIRGTPLLVQLFIIFYGLPTIGVIIDR
jgi:cystine transport system permease protein